MRLGLILSNDWELFGDGSGDYFEVQHRPLAELLACAARHEARISVLAEVGQQWAHQVLAASEPWAGEVASAWEEILRETIRAGSDVQLHLHPQWLSGRREDGRWRLDMGRCSIASLPREVVTATLGRGKRYLESLLTSVDPGYRCLAFRAGAYCIQPSREIIASLRATGFLADSSVTGGLALPGEFDNADAHSDWLPWFTGAEDVRYAGSPAEGVLEIPVGVARVWDSRLLRRLGGDRVDNLLDRLNLGARATRQDERWRRERDHMLAVRYPVRNRPFHVSSNGRIAQLLCAPGRVADLALSRRAVQLDYDYLTPGAFVAVMDRIALAAQSLHGADDLILPVMASGHVKNMPDTANLDRTLDAVARHFGERLIHWTYRAAVDHWTDGPGARFVGGESPEWARKGPAASFSFRP
jgi:hypothetical protein